MKSEFSSENFLPSYIFDLLVVNKSISSSAEALIKRDTQTQQVIKIDYDNLIFIIRLIDQNKRRTKMIRVRLRRRRHRMK
jgi:hypothetical protein